MRTHPKASICALRPSSTQKPAIATTGCLTLILQQNRKTTLHISRQAPQSHTKPIDTPRLTTGHWTNLWQDKIQVHPPERRHKSPNQETFTGHWSSPTYKEEIPQIKTDYNSPACSKETPNSKLSKMQRQRNVQKVKEHGENLPDQTRKR